MTDTAMPAVSQGPHSRAAHSGGMTPMKRSRRLQAGLAGLTALAAGAVVAAIIAGRRTAGR